MKPQKTALTRFDSWRAHALAVGLTMLLLALAYPRPGWWVLGHIALAPLTLLALQTTRVRRLMLTTWLGGWLWWLLMLRWLIPVTLPGYVVLCAYLGLYWLAYGWMMRRLDRSWRMPMVAAVPLAWVSLEFIRGHIVAGGFGWFGLGHIMANWQPTGRAPWMVQIADLGGEWTVSLLVAMGSGLAVDALRLPWGPWKSKKLSRPAWSYLVWMTAMLAAWSYAGYALGRHARQSDAPALTVAVIQTNVPQNNRNHPTWERMLSDWQRIQELTVEAVRGKVKPDLVVWPETVVPAALNPEAIAYYQNTDSPERVGLEFARQVRDLATGLGVWMMVGAHAKFDWQPIAEPDGTVWEFPRRRHNSAYLVSPDVSQPMSRYDKTHLVPFGEYVPWVSAWPWLKQQFFRWFSPYDFDYSVSPGESLARFVLPGASVTWRLATPICFEDAVPRVVRTMVYGEGRAKQVDLLLNLTNDGWFAGHDQGLQHVQIAALRCIENRVPMARAVNTGVSGLIDSAGRVVVLVQRGGRVQQVDGYTVGELPRDSTGTLYGRVGGCPMAVLSLAALFLSIWPGLWTDNRQMADNAASR